CCPHFCFAATAYPGTAALSLHDALPILPGGVNSPVRAFRAVGGTPFFVARAEGSRLTDVDGRTYLDYVCSWGPLILGHAHPAVRSEEHTSELQSRSDLVCRLLLEKKNNR